MQASYLEETPQERPNQRATRSPSKTYRRTGRDGATDAGAKETSSRPSSFHPWESATIDLKDKSARGARKRAPERDAAAGPPGQTDPFDPEVFNRQYSSSNRSTRAAEPADRSSPPPGPGDIQGPAPK